MTVRSRKQLGPFPFAEAVRDRTEAIAAPNDWKLGGRSGSFTASFLPVRHQIAEARGLEVNAQYWVARPSRVSFEFFPRPKNYGALTEILAADFREFLGNRGVPQSCAFSNRGTVLRVRVQKGGLSDDGLMEGAIDLFKFISDNIETWRLARLGLLLQGIGHPDALADLHEYESSYSSLPETEREEVRKSRIGQGIFRLKLLDYWHRACAVTGMSQPLVLRASHIKSWRISNNVERLDPYNGLLLSPNLDALFDAGLISFDDNGRILIGDALSAEDRDRMGIDMDFKLRSIEESHRKYLKFHRIHVFRANVD